MKPKHWILTGALSAAAAVALGAIGAHAMESWLAKSFEPDVATARMETWQTAAHYHRFHAIGLIVVGLLLRHKASRCISVGGYLMLVGTILFSGLLYVYSITGSKWMGPIFPLGGLSYIFAWLLLGIGVARQPDQPGSRE